MSIPESYAAHSVLQVHDHVHLGVQRDSGICDHRVAGGTRQEVRDRTGNLCEINGTRLQRQCSGLRYIYLHSVRPKYLPLHPILKQPQAIFPKYEREIILTYISNFILFK